MTLGLNVGFIPQRMTAGSVCRHLKIVGLATGSISVPADGSAKFQHYRLKASHGSEQYQLNELIYRVTVGLLLGDARCNMAFSAAELLHRMARDRSELS